jgi:hypothetical protein
VEEVIQSAGGKFRVQAITSQADLIRLSAKDHEQGMLLQVMHLRNSSGRVLRELLNGELNNEGGAASSLILRKMAGVKSTPRTRLLFLLLNFSLHKPERGGIYNFTEMAEELADIVFEQPRTLSCYLEKVFAIDKTWNEIQLAARKERIRANTSVNLATNATMRATLRFKTSTLRLRETKFYHLDYVDPLHEKLCRIDDTFKRHGISARTDYNEIITAITTLLLMHERVSSMQWAVKNLEYKNKRHVKPVLEEPLPPPAEMPASAVFLSTM